MMKIRIVVPRLNLPWSLVSDDDLIAFEAKFLLENSSDLHGEFNAMNRNLLLDLVRETNLLLLLELILLWSVLFEDGMVFIDLKSLMEKSVSLVLTVNIEITSRR
ncbi:hypothetical protein SLE2022_206590 [Rubroshorea leprosula]